MEVTKTNAEWDATYRHMKTLGNLKGVKFAYAVSKNSDKIESQLKHLEGLLKADPAFEAYEKERVAIVEKYAEKDEHGNPIIENDVYKVDPELVKPEVLELDKKHKDALEARTKQINDFNELLKEDYTINIHPIKVEELPSDISVAQMGHIQFMIEE